MFLERVEKKACENDGMVVKEEVRYSFRPTNPPGNFGFTSVPGGTGQDLGCALRTDLGEIQRDGAENACDTVLYLSW